MRKFNHYIIFKIVIAGYLALNIIGLLGLIFHLVTGNIEADFGIY
jgi:hypothetical protein